MSHVTDIILIVGIGEDINIINEYIKKDHPAASFSQVDIYAGGHKAIQCDVYMVAINGFDIDKFVAFYCNVTWWKYPEETQVLIKDEHDNLFTVYLPNSLKLQ